MVIHLVLPSRLVEVETQTGIHPARTLLLHQLLHLHGGLTQAEHHLVLNRLGNVERQTSVTHGEVVELEARDVCESTQVSIQWLLIELRMLAVVKVFNAAKLIGDVLLRTQHGLIQLQMVVVVVGRSDNELIVEVVELEHHRIVTGLLWQLDDLLRKFIVEQRPCTLDCVEGLWHEHVAPGCWLEARCLACCCVVWLL